MGTEGSSTMALLWSGTSRQTVEGQLLLHISLVKQITPTYGIRQHLQPLKPLFFLPNMPETLT